jgi:CRISPR-associated endonuclease/helicase Cas3
MLRGESVLGGKGVDIVGTGAGWRTPEPWAKLAPRDRPRSWHPLAAHAHDVAACAAALLARPLTGLHLARLAGVDALPPLWRDRLVVLAFLHDFGKANHAFQERRGGHITEALPLLTTTDLAEPAGLTLLDGWFTDTEAAVAALATVLAHHGAPPPPARTGRGSGHAREWQAKDGYEPLRAVHDLVDEARRCWPAAFATAGAPLPEAPAFWHAFLGLLQLSDWLGSDPAPDAFPFAEAGEAPRNVRARPIAARLLERLGLDADRLRRAMPAVGFAAVAGEGLAARPIQAAAVHAAGPIVVLESETGSGKTESALYRFAHLFQEGRVDGLYFALPTRLAASQMVARVQQAVARLFPDPENRPVVVRAVPGDAGADGHGLQRLPEFAVQWDDDPDAGERRRRWAAEGPKRFLAATIAVGTIDQALLGAVRVKHAQMRSFCLVRTLLVVDEVHASGRYMARILENLLAQHLGAGGEALLLSATLGAEARTRLLLGHLMDAQRLARAMPTQEQALAVAYPAISSVRDGRIVTTGHAGSAQEKAVEMEPAARIGDAAAVAARALAAAEAGARVLVIRNTVGDAVATRAALAQCAPDGHAQFHLQGIGTLHHSRFAREDRRRLDAEVEAQFGRDAARQGGLVLVGTQTLEISLDIDADLLITDLCPADVLLQRIGRLHRHARPRPAGCEAPRCVVLMPDDFEAGLKALARGGGGPHGHGTVYEDLLVLEATRRLIGEGAQWVIPRMNRALVEQATHPQAIAALAEALAADDPRWAEAALQRDGRGAAERMAANTVIVAWNAAVWTFRPDENAATRLGSKDVELRFDDAPTGAFGAPVSRLVIPHHLNPSGAFEPDAFVQNRTGFTFRLGDTAFVYDQFGLRRAETQRNR